MLLGQDSSGSVWNSKYLKDVWRKIERDQHVGACYKCYHLEAIGFAPWLRLKAHSGRSASEARTGLRLAWKRCRSSPPSKQSMKLSIVGCAWIWQKKAGS